MDAKLYEVRLECLKLAHTQGRDIAEVLGRAKKYEEYIVSETKKSNENLRKKSEKVDSEHRELFK